jgi:hypothetical protein
MNAALPAPGDSSTAALDVVEESPDAEVVVDVVVDVEDGSAARSGAGFDVHETVRSKAKATPDSAPPRAFTMLCSPRGRAFARPPARVSSTKRPGHLNVQRPAPNVFGAHLDRRARGGGYT